MIPDSPTALFDTVRWRGLRIGLLGGSFNPAHKGHLHISRIALRALHLDYVWWLVSPQNPLKDVSETLPWEERLSSCREITLHPRIRVSEFEKKVGSNKTYNTLKTLLRTYPSTSFVWLTGLDNALSFHKWYRWRDILQLVATAHIARPPAKNIVRSCPLRLYNHQTHIHVLFLCVFG